uniref:Uncharacterized protein n=1 Tax=Arundo donax TaxID=35708 RepID=A0A0A9FGF4_ARUDO
MNASRRLVPVRKHKEFISCTCLILY